MLKSPLFFVLFIIISLATSAQIKPADKYPPVTVAGSQYITFRSAINQHDYTVSISLPNSYNDSANKKYPVLYVLDGQWSFTQEMGLLGGLNFDYLVPEVLLVAIGWPDKYEEQRARDLTPTVTQRPGATGEARQFLDVIKREVIPFVNKSYRADTARTILSGGSYGGLFALFTLFQEPDLFRDFIIGSPSVDYDDELLFKMEETFSKQRHHLDKKIFFHWGRYETDFDASHYFQRFYQQMKSRNYQGLQMDSVGVPLMAHASNGPYGEALGLQHVLRKPDLELDGKLLDEYAGTYERDVKVTHEGKWLYLNWPNVKVKMNAETPTLFYVPGLPGTGEFLRDDKGKVDRYKVRFYGQEMLSKKLK